MVPQGGMSRNGSSAKSGKRSRAAPVDDIEKYRQKRRDSDPRNCRLTLSPDETICFFILALPAPIFTLLQHLLWNSLLTVKSRPSKMLRCYNPSWKIRSTASSVLSGGLGSQCAMPCESIAGPICRRSSYVCLACVMANILRFPCQQNLHASDASAKSLAK